MAVATDAPLAVSRPRSGVAIIATASLFFGVLPVVTRTLAGRVPAAQISALRFAVGLGAVLLLFLARRRGPNLTHWKLLFLRGFFGGGAVLTYFLAIERLGAAAATVMNYSSPVAAAVVAALFLKERSSWAQRGGLLVATCGAALVAWASGGNEHATDPLMGVVAGLCSAVLGGSALAVMKRVRDDTDALTVFFAFCSVGLAMSAPLALSKGWVPLDADAWRTCLAVGVLGLLGQLLLTWGMGHTSATVGSATTQLVPVIAWALALGWLHEAVTPLGVLGALLTVGGVGAGAVTRPSGT